jgi:signal transduction histidine kinase
MTDHPTRAHLNALTARLRAAESGDAPFAAPDGAPPELAALVEALNALRARERQERDALARARDAAEAANRAKSAFLANMSHELRTPLNAILGFTEMMAGGLYGPVSDEQRSRLLRIQANGQSLLGLLNEVLDLARIEAGKAQVVRNEVDLGPLLRTIAASLEPDVRRQALDLRVLVAPDLPRLRTDVDRLQQVLGNLLSNALKFTEQGEITLQAAHAPDRAGWVRITVADTGIGIPAAALDRVWEEFYQAPPAAGPRRAGAGLGLPISRRLAELLGGEIRVESQERAGSRFTVDLPARPADE